MDRAALIDVLPDKLEEWTLVLDAEGIPYRMVRREAGWSLAVPSGQLELALRVLTAYEQENPAPDHDELASSEWGDTTAGLLLAALLAAFYAFVIWDGPREWFDRGATVAELIRAGALWRLVTALTLHASLAHIVSNAFSAALFVTVVCRSLGPGLGWAAVLGAGAAGNWINAYVQGAGHRSVGASTAVFGAVGILAATQVARQRQVSFRRAWVPLVAGLALLALLGTGEMTDIGAHLFGFVAGGVIGFGLGTKVDRPPGKWAQIVLGAATLCVVALAWWRAWQ